jgi:hypothetical protein
VEEDVSLPNVVRRFKTGTYAVARATTPDTYSNGIRIHGVTEVIPVDGSVQPMSETDMKDAPEGFNVEDLRVMYSTSAMYVIREAPGNPDASLPADSIQLEGKTWRVVKVAHYKILSNHWRSYLTWKPIP